MKKRRFVGVWEIAEGDGVAFYGRVYAEILKEKDRRAKRLIAALEAAGDALYIEITGERGHYHHWNSISSLEFDDGRNRICERNGN